MEALKSLAHLPGFGFHPNDSELISYYLKRKVLGQSIDCDVIPEVDIYKHEPWELPEHCKIPTSDSQWHFFTSLDKKYPEGSRSKRATYAGYWKSTGKDRSIKEHKRTVGTKKTLVYHKGRPPSGKRTEWIMHEFSINKNEFGSSPEMKGAFVICRITKRNEWASEGQQLSSDDDANSTSQKVPLRKKEAVPLPKSNLSDNEDEMDAWIAELLNPNFPQDEPSVEAEDPAIVVPKKEFPAISDADPFYLHLEDIEIPKREFPAICESDLDFLHQEDFEYILQDQDLVFPQSPPVHQEHTEEQPDSGTGIVIRSRAGTTNERPANPYKGRLKNLPHREVTAVSELTEQTSKSVESRRLVSVRGTAISRLIPGAIIVPSAGSSTNGSNGGIKPGNRTVRWVFNCSRFVMRRTSKRGMPSKDNKSASLHLLMVFICVIATGAMILYFMLGDGPRLLKGLSPLESI